jgi:hypothetical protein
MEHYVGLDVSLKLTAICIVLMSGDLFAIRSFNEAPNERLVSVAR